MALKVRIIIPLPLFILSLVEVNGVSQHDTRP